MTRQSLILLVSMCLAGTAATQPVPMLTGRVVDEAQILSPQIEASLSALLAAHEEAAGNQIAVLTIGSLEGSSIEAHANRVFRAWGLGRADADNGVLLLIARGDRELRIEVGHGLESSLTDAEAGRIIRNVIVPLFREGDFEGGALAGVNAIIGTIEGEYAPPEGEAVQDEFPWWAGLLFLCTHFLLPLFLGIRSLVSPPVSRYFTLAFTLLFMAPTVFIFGGLIAGGAAVIGGAFVLLTYVVGYAAADVYMSRSPKWQDIRAQVRAARKSGKSRKIDAGWISFSAGGSSSSGGGFSGGGGSSGGGGASGSW